MTQFKTFVETCNQIEQISSSLEITDIVSDFLGILNEKEISVSCYMLMGDLFPAWKEKELGLGPSMLYSAISRASGYSVPEIKDMIREHGDIGDATFAALSKQKKTQFTLSFFTGGNVTQSLDTSGVQTLSKKSDILTISDVYDNLVQIADISGRDSQLRKIKVLESLYSKSTPEEARYISRIALQEIRIGVGEAIIRDAIANKFNVDLNDIDVAYMVVNDLGEVARVAKTGGSDAVRRQTIQIGRPIKMMLAQVTPSLKTAFSEMECMAVEWKFDGVRIQIHKDGDRVMLYSRKLEEISLSLPDIVDSVLECVHADTVILDGEAVAIDSDGRPRAFQDTMRRFRRKYNVEEAADSIPIRVNVFDIMYLNGENLINTPYIERRKLLSSVVSNCPNIYVDDFLIVSSPEEAYSVYESALKAGHEGIMLKNPQSFYSPGKRGKNWLKKKPVMDTLDLVVTGGEWGVGRRANKIGSYNLSCLDPSDGNFCEISKVGTGLSDELLDELTLKLSGIITKTEGTLIDVHPEVIFEVAFEEIQKSPNTKAGYSLRFPRLVRVRTDKSLKDIDTLEKIELMYESQNIS